MQRSPKSHRFVWTPDLVGKQTKIQGITFIHYALHHLPHHTTDTKYQV